MLTRLPSLHHLSIFADPSDDLTLSLLFSHPAMLAIAPRLRSFGWRLRASPPSALREFDNSTMYVSIQGWLRECTRLGFLVLDSDIEQEGVREVDLDRVVACLGDGRERTIRRRAREARRGKREDPVPRRGPARAAEVGSSGKRKFDAEGEDVGPAKRCKVESSASHQLVHHPVSRHAQASPLQTLADEETDASTPSNLSLMLCGPIQGWMLSPEAEVWAAENMDDLRAWMMETRAKISTDSVCGMNDCSSTLGQGRGVHEHSYTRRDEPTPGPEPGATSIPTNGLRTFRESSHTTGAPGPLLSPVSVLSSSYSPVIPIGAANGATAYFQHHHHDHFAQHDSDGIQPYIHQIASTPYQPHYAGIVPSYTSNVPAAPSPTAGGYPVRPTLRSHSRSHTPLSAAERRKMALENRPPVFLDGIIRQFTGIKELFIDRPVRARYGSEEDTLRFLVSRRRFAVEKAADSWRSPSRSFRSSTCGNSHCCRSADIHCPVTIS